MVADTGEKLIKLCASAKPDIIITDNLMPDIDGADAAAIIYAERPTPIILLSGYCDRKLVLDAEQKHVLMYLVKPISDANLRAALARCRERLAMQSGLDDSSDALRAGEFHRATAGRKHRFAAPALLPTRRPFGRRRTPSIQSVKSLDADRRPASGAGAGEGSAHERGAVLRRCCSGPILQKDKA